MGSSLVRTSTLCDSFAGISLCNEHYRQISESKKLPVDYFEIIAENFFDPIDRLSLETLRKDYPISVHGVSLSLGSEEKLCNNHLKNLKELVTKIDPFLISDHLCFTRNAHHDLHNLMPVVYDDHMLQHLSERIDQVQNYLAKPLAIENLSHYLNYRSSTYEEWDFIAALVKHSGCTLILDINNIYVNSQNHDFCPKKFMDVIPVEAVVEIHLAGHEVRERYLFDTHSCKVQKNVWELYRYAQARFSQISTLIEWDNDIPDLQVLLGEALLIKKIQNEFI